MDLSVICYLIAHVLLTIFFITSNQLPAVNCLLDSFTGSIIPFEINRNCVVSALNRKNCHFSQKFFAQYYSL